MNFWQLVFDMRTAQKRYFRTRSHDDLQESKRLERLVDEELKADGQKSLFDGKREQ